MSTRGMRFFRPDRTELPENETWEYSLTTDAPSYKVYLESQNVATLRCDNSFWYRETINHDLGYYPAFFSYIKDPDTGRWSNPVVTSGGYHVVALHIDEDTIRFHIMYFMPGITAYCGGCPKYGDVAGPPSEELEVEYKYIVTIDPLYEP